MLGKILDGLSDDFQLPERGVLTHAVVDKRVMAATAVRGHIVECVANVLEVDAVVSHSTAASARIRFSK